MLSANSCTESHENFLFHLAVRPSSLHLHLHISLVLATAFMEVGWLWNHWECGFMEGISPNLPVSLECAAIPADSPSPSRISFNCWNESLQSVFLKTSKNVLNEFCTSWNIIFAKIIKIPPWKGFKKILKLLWCRHTCVRNVLRELMCWEPGREYYCTSFLGTRCEEEVGDSEESPECYILPKQIGTKLIVCC